MFFVYNIFAVLTSPVWLAWMWIRAAKRAEKPKWSERTGNYQHIQIPKDQPALWIHAVSVGEVMAVLPILKQLRALAPDHFIVLSVTTSSGHSTAREHALDLYDALVYFPIDLARFQLSAMMRIRPDAVAIMETELWFSFLWAAKAIGARTLLINGRISDRSFPRSKRIRVFYAALLKMMDRCLMQTEIDAERITNLGATRAEVIGNVKFDQAIDGLDANPEDWKEALGLDKNRPTLVIGSTRGEEEEDFVAYALKSLRNQVNIVWAPRHLERVPELKKYLEKQWEITFAQRSLNQKGPCIILDTYGELAKVYSLADIVIIGGGFANLGGQNLIQAMAHGKPVIHGQYMQNFRDAAENAKRCGASQAVSSPEALEEAVTQLLADPQRRAEMGKAGAELVAASAGAARSYALAILDQAP